MQCDIAITVHVPELQRFCDGDTEYKTILQLGNVRFMALLPATRTPVIRYTPLSLINEVLITYS